MCWSVDTGECLSFLGRKVYIYIYIMSLYKLLLFYKIIIIPTKIIDTVVYIDIS